MSLWGSRSKLLVFIILAFFSCEEDIYEVGIKSPDENFKVSFKEFTLPTTSFLADSVVTSNGSGGTDTKRLLAGAFNDSRYGTGTAMAHTQFFPTTFPSVHDTATVLSVTLTAVLDYYYFGEKIESGQTFEVRELADSLVNSRSYFANSQVGLSSAVIGTGSIQVDPFLYDESIIANNKNPNVADNIVDSINFTLSESFGRRLLDVFRDPDSAVVFQNFRKWRRILKGLAIVPTSTDKVLGIDPGHAKSRIVLAYREAGTTKYVNYSLQPAAGIHGFSSISVNRAGSEVAPLTSFYNEFDFPGGRRYIQSGAGIQTSIDLTEVYDYFKNIPVKALNVAELSIESDEQPTAPQALMLRALRPDNRYMTRSKVVFDNAGDPVVTVDAAFFGKHFVNPESSPRLEALGDDNLIFNLSQTANSGTLTYKGYLTNFLQYEVELTEGALNYFTLLPSSPEFGKSVNGLYFDKNSVKLRVYYTTPIQEE